MSNTTPNTLSPELKVQIEKEAEARYDIGLGGILVLKQNGYKEGAEAYALKLQQAEAMMGKMAGLLNEATIPISQVGTKEAAALLRTIKKELNNYKQSKDDSVNG